MPDNAIDRLAGKLYSVQPSRNDLFFHYTSLGAMLSIIRERSLWATDIRYASDAAELRHLMQSLVTAIDRRDSERSNEVLRQFRAWLPDRLLMGNMVFAASFSIQGNLLSQWRAYCPPAKGVSLGFRPESIVRIAQRQSFTVGRCIYDPKEQDSIVSEIIDAVVSLATDSGPADASKYHPSQSYHEVFYEVEESLLRIGALFKHPGFREEYEWRAVSPVFTKYVGTGIKYREGQSMLIPYLPFVLSQDGDPARLHTVFLGPTPHANVAVESVARFLTDNGESPAVFGPSIPYRTW